MKVEVHSAADFLMNLLRVKQAHSSLPEHQLQHFNRSLQSLLVLRFRSHWYPDLPARGSGYRCIRINGKMDPVVEQAGAAVGLQPPTLRRMLPTELTLWIDPEEVAYRIGENGSICVLYDSSSRASPASDVGSAGSGGEEFVMERRCGAGSHRGQPAVAADVQMLRYVARSVVAAAAPPTDGIRTPSPPSSASSSSSSVATLMPVCSPHLNSSDSSSQMSPPLSPQYHQSHGRHFANRQQHLYGERQQMYQWSGSDDGYAAAHSMAGSGKVRSQC